MMSLNALLLRDMRVAVRVGGGALMGVLFFLVVVTLTPFAVGPDLVLLKRIGPAILWLAALLASLLALDRLFAGDHEDGSLDLILTGRAPLELVVAVKGIAHWLTTALPLVIAAPLLGLFLNLDAPAEAGLMLTLLVRNPFHGRMRADAGKPCGRTFCRRRRFAAGNGIKALSCKSRGPARQWALFRRRSG